MVDNCTAPRMPVSFVSSKRRSSTTPLPGAVCMTRLRPTRRDVLRLGCGALGLSLPAYLGLNQLAQGSQAAWHGRARSCIVLYCWGGMSHHETWDLKTNAPPEYRGEFQPIATVVPGIHVG